MIQKESWYVESDSLEKQQRRLIEMAERGEIPPERFMQLMLRIHGRGKQQVQDGLQFLSRNRNGQLILTSEWLVFHKDWINEIADLRDRLADVLLWGVDLPRSRGRIVSGIWAALRLHFSGDNQMLGIFDYVASLHRQFGSVGNTVFIGYGWYGYALGKDSGEAEFNKYVQEVIQKANEFLMTSARPEFAADWEEPQQEIDEPVGM